MLETRALPRTRNFYVVIAVIFIYTILIIILDDAEF